MAAERSRHNYHACSRGEDSHHVCILTAKTVGLFSEEWKHPERRRQSGDVMAANREERQPLLCTKPLAGTTGVAVRSQAICSKPGLSKAILPQQHLTDYQTEATQNSALYHLQG